MAEFRPGQPRAGGAARRAARAAGLLIETGVPGVYGRGGDFEDVRERVDRARHRAGAGRAARAAALPAGAARATQLETIGYLEIVPAPGRQHLRLRGRPRRGGRAVRARRRHEDWSEFQDDDRPGAHAGRLLPGLPGGRRARAARAGRGHGRRRRLLRLPPRALGRPGAAADVPPARDRAHRRARDRRSVARRVARSRASSCCGSLGLESQLDVANDPFFGRSGRMLAAQPARSRS